MFFLWALIYVDIIPGIVAAILLLASGETNAKRWQSRDMERTWAPDHITKLMNQLILESLHLEFPILYCLS